MLTQEEKDKIAAYRPALPKTRSDVEMKTRVPQTGLTIELARNHLINFKRRLEQITPCKSRGEMYERDHLRNDIAILEAQIAEYEGRGK